MTAKQIFELEKKQKECKILMFDKKKVLEGKCQQHDQSET